MMIVIQDNLIRNFFFVLFDGFGMTVFVWWSQMRANEVRDFILFHEIVNVESVFFF